MLRFATEGGQEAVLVPLALETVVERTPGIELFQIVQSAPDTLRIRLRTAEGVDPQTVHEPVRAGLANLLAEHNLTQVKLEATDEEPEQTAGGKYPHVIPYPA